MSGLSGGLLVRSLLSSPTAAIQTSATSSGSGTVLTAAADGAFSFQQPLYSELLVDQTGAPILAQFASGGPFDIIMTVQQL
jgi:hypothetical protein